MNIVYKKINEIIPYEKNPRKNDEAVEYVKESISQFGFKVPIVIDKNNIVVTGHTRLKASKKLGYKEVPCIIADDLSDEEIKAFRLADNKVSEKAEWDFDLLNEEMEDIFNIDMEEFGFEFYDEELEHEKNQESTQRKVSNILNLDNAQYEGVGKYDIPEIAPVYELPEIKEWIGFNYVLSDDEPEGKAVHFFIDDYQFERIWNNPNRYVEKLRRYAAVCSPDFSPYGDMPLATQIFNHYRKHWVAKYFQDRGVNIIPTIRSSTDERSLEFYLDGEPKGGIVIISSMWTNKEETLEIFKKEYQKMYETLKPKKVFLYGRMIEGLEGDIEIVENFTTKRWGDK
jgi:hypothetical protein